MVCQLGAPCLRPSKKNTVYQLCDCFLITTRRVCKEDVCLLWFAAGLASRFSEANSSLSAKPSAAPFQSVSRFQLCLQHTLRGTPVSSSSSRFSGFSLCTGVVAPGSPRGCGALPPSSLCSSCVHCVCPPRAGPRGGAGATRCAAMHPHGA